MQDTNTIRPIELSPEPVQGVAMARVTMLRLDRLGGRAPGNKVFKLRHNLEQARQQGVTRFVSFGGAWSNHLHALAAVGAELGLETVGLVRGEVDESDTPMLAEARGWGMAIRRISRSDYRLRNNPDFLARVKTRFEPCLVIPEGGANAAGVRGCMAIADLIRASTPGAATVVLPVGTGTTLAGLVAGLSPPIEVLGIAALKGASDLEQRVVQLLGEAAVGHTVPWRIRHDFHCGGFARSSDELRAFILEFERVQGIPLEPVYTGKMMYAIHCLLQRGEWHSDDPIIAIHTGGLQGRRGYAWLTEQGATR